MFLAGHLALDFLNTRMRVDGKIVDVLQRDQDVLDWLKQAGLAVPKVGPHAARMSLRDPARTLRENIRSLVEKRKAGQRGDPSVLNRFLSAAPKPTPPCLGPDALAADRKNQTNKFGPGDSCAFG